MSHDPIHYLERAESSELGYEYQPGWYFWDEVWADRIGPFQTNEQAQLAMKQYLESRAILSILKRRSAVNPKNIEKLVRARVAMILVDLAAFVAGEWLGDGFTSAKKLNLNETFPEQSIKKRTEEEMRCRYTTASRHRCKKRSGGPRFRFLCKEHRQRGSK